MVAITTQHHPYISSCKIQLAVISTEATYVEIMFSLLVLATESQ